MKEAQRDHREMMRSNSDVSNNHLKSPDEMSKIREKLKDYQVIVNNNKHLSLRISQVFISLLLF